MKRVLEFVIVATIVTAISFAIYPPISEFVDRIVEE